MALRGHWPWSVLEVEPGASTTELKRAYARKLRVTHPEDDPEGFQALRQAYEAALARASGHTPHSAPGFSPSAGRLVEYGDEDARDEPVEETVPDHVTSEPRGRIVDPEPEPGPPKSRSTAVPAGPDPREAFWTLQNELVAAIRSPYAGEAEKVAALKALLASPALDNVSLYAQTETWLASLIAQGAPATDPLLEPVVAAYRWEKAEGRWDTPHDIAHLLERRTTLAHLQTLQRRTSTHHKAYKLLRRPTPKGLRGALHMGWHAFHVSALIRKLEAERAVAAEFDRDTLNTWRKFILSPLGSTLAWILRGGFRLGIGFGALLAFIIVCVMIGSVAGEKSGADSYPEVSAPEAGEVFNRTRIEAPPFVVPRPGDGKGRDYGKTTPPAAAPNAAPKAPETYSFTPEWITKATTDDLRRALPSTAGLAPGVYHVEIACQVIATGRLASCRIAQETPNTIGFGEAVKSLSLLYQMKPVDSQGRKVAGATYSYGFNYTKAEPAPPPPPSAAPPPGVTVGPKPISPPEKGAPFQPPSLP